MLACDALAGHAYRRGEPPAWAVLQLPWQPADPDGWMGVGQEC